MEYANKLFNLYNTKMVVTDIEALILVNGWVALLNRNIFIFMNDQLIMSKIL